MIPELLKDRSILLLGFGVEGQGSYEFLRKRFPHKLISIADRHSQDQLDIRPEVLSNLKNDREVRFLCGENYLRSLESYDVIIKSPGIPSSHPALRAFESRGGIITSHLEIFFDLFDRKRVIGVTGTKGKSTTTSLTYKILGDAGVDVILGGNIGEPPLTRLDQAHERTYFVLELSSYQLEPLRKSPHIAILLDIVPEHLDYHSSFSAYVAAKENITKYQDAFDYLVYNSDYTLPNEISSRTQARLFPFSMKGSPPRVLALFLVHLLRQGHLDGQCTRGPPAYRRPRSSPARRPRGRASGRGSDRLALKHTLTPASPDSSGMKRNSCVRTALICRN